MDRATRQRFGKTGVAIHATKAYVRPLNFSDDKISAKSWMLVNEQAGTVTFVNTYDGNAGRNFDAAAATYPLTHLNGDEQKKRMKSYTEAPVSDCPVAVVVEAELVTA